MNTTIIDERIRNFFVKLMRLKLSQREEEVGKAVMRVRSEANRYGALHSSRADLNVRKVYEEKYDEICKDAWSELHHIAKTIGVNPDDSLAIQLRDVFDEVMKPLAESYLGALRSKVSTTRGITGDIIADAEASFSRSREIVGIGIGLFSSNTAMMVSESKPTYIQHYNTFTGTFGAVQQGDHPVATVIQNIDSRGLEVLRNTIDSLTEKFGNHDQLAPLIEELKAETERPQPQLKRIRDFLTGIKACIGVIKDGKELFEAVETAALACGMDALPSISL